MLVRTGRSFRLDACTIILPSSCHVKGILGARNLPARNQPSRHVQQEIPQCRLVRQAKFGCSRELKGAHVTPLSLPGQERAEISPPATAPPSCYNVLREAAMTNSIATIPRVIQPMLATSARPFD